ncbi:unnamed protein product [Cylicocyclus nassatus]|uniref:Uncharacterized protein n=1 Tax=Cylicocyclus nassatus TaxID=53992 RepID=A0AA36DSP6_CYLNA|nr:unnamed protein product [Cylicocyclus nassatus]
MHNKEDIKPDMQACGEFVAIKPEWKPRQSRAGNPWKIRYSYAITDKGIEVVAAARYKAGDLNALVEGGEGMYGNFVGVPTTYSDYFVGASTIAHQSYVGTSGTRTLSTSTSDTNSRVAAKLSNADTDRDIVLTNLAADLDGAGMSIAKLRTAFQIQRFYEKCARGGRRYIEQIKSHFNVNSPDARMQRSEYLGGSRIPIHISEIVCSDSSDIGKLGSTSRTNGY